jgi:WD40 repeat protein
MTGKRFGSIVLSLFCISLALAPTSAQAQEVTAVESPTGHTIQTWDDLPDWVTSLVFLKDGRHVCIGTYEELSLRDVRGSDAVKSLPLPSGYAKSLALSPDGKLLAVGHYQALTLVDPAKWSIKRDIGQHPGYVTGVAFSPDGKLLATACEDGAARLWNVADGKLVREFNSQTYPCTAVTFSPDGKWIATSDGDENRVTQPGEVRTWSVADGKQLLSFIKHKQAATDVAFSPDGKWLASTGFDHRVILHHFETHSGSYFDGHTRPTNAVLFGPTGQVLVSAAGGRQEGDNEVKIWERDTGKELATYALHKAKVSAIALSPDASLLATGGYDKMVAVWDVKSVLAVPEKKPEPKPVRIGVIGLDTSHCGAFAGELNKAHPAADVAGFKIVAAYPRGSADIESSTKRVPEYTRNYQKMGIEIVGSVDELLKKVDVVMLETNDGRPHYEQALAVIKSGKRLFIDKPIAGSLANAVAIFEASRKYHVPLFCSSSLRFGKETLAARNGKIGKIERCETTSPCHLEKTHPDLYWYGVHGVESLFTVMGTGCKSVRRTVSTPTEDVVIGTWEGGRTGTFHGTRSNGGYSGTAYGSKGTLKIGQYEGYRPLVVEIVKFFKTGVPPVSEQETLEIYAFMTAADESKHKHGAEVTLESVLSAARAEAAQKPEAHASKK